MIVQCPHCRAEIEVEIAYGLEEGPMANLAATLQAERHAIQEIVDATPGRLHLAENLEAVAPTDRAREHLAQVIERRESER